MNSINSPNNTIPIVKPEAVIVDKSVDSDAIILAELIDNIDNNKAQK